MTDETRPDSVIRCRTRCLDACDVDRARVALKDRPAVSFPYTCTISGRTENLVLISETLADTLVRRVAGIGDRLDATLAAALLRTDLCECDLVTLSSRPEASVLQSIRRLSTAGLLRPRTVHGMNYHALVEGPEVKALRDAVEAELAG